jgi:Tfp pilus assembly protein PilF
MAQAGGRLAITVKDKNGEPVEGVKITVTTEKLPSFLDTLQTNKKGKVVLAVQDATLTYTLTFEKEGYSTLKQPVSVPLGDISFKTYELPPQQEVKIKIEAPEETEAAPQTKDPALMAYNSAVLAMRSGDLDLALEKLREAIELRGDWAMAHSTLALVLFERGEHAEAAAEAERTLELEPEDFKALNVRYRAYAALGEEDKTEQARRALRDAGEAEDAAKRVFNEGVDLLEKGDAATAQARFQEALALDPSLKPAHHALVTLLFQQGEYGSAELESIALLEEDPGNLNLLRIRYDSARLGGDLQSLREATAALIEFDPPAIQVLHEQATRYFDEGKATTAQSILEALTSHQGAPPRSFYVLGLCYLNTGKMDEAKAAMTTFVERAPDDPDAATAKALIGSGG